MASLYLHNSTVHRNKPMAQKCAGEKLELAPRKKIHLVLIFNEYRYFTQRAGTRQLSQVRVKHPHHDTIPPPLEPILTSKQNQYFNKIHTQCIVLVIVLETNI